MELYLVRHGQTAWNRDRICQGQTDVPLSETGIEQAEALARRLADTDFDAAWSSDLVRAHETARIVLEGRAVTLQTSPALREMAFGEWEGQDLGALFERLPEERDRWLNAPASWRPPGGECLGEVQARMCEHLDGLRDLHPDGRVLVVAHGFAILTYVCAVIGLPIQRFRHLWLDPTSISEIRFGGRVPILKRHNDHAHLPAPRP
ncbi:MAG: histidine phosphatase family protein [Myxococcota bacterium]|jgi:broad specificity phosphatase PhoE|nr:histidine phosphatase family protein [Myxococcota bacterium]